jgi:hypothetical protein
MKKLLDIIFPTFSMSDSELTQVDTRGLHMQAVPTNEALEQRMKAILEELEVLGKDSFRHFLAGCIFLAIMIVAGLFNLFILQVGAMFVYIWLFLKGETIHKRMVQRMAFLDGMLFILADVARTVKEARENGSITEEDIKELLAKKGIEVKG